MGMIRCGRRHVCWSGAAVDEGGGAEGYPVASTETRRLDYRIIQSSNGRKPTFTFA